MSAPDNDFASRREILSSEITRQRGELARAYLALEKPIHYAEYGMRGFGFLRQNPWVFAAVPALFSMGSTLVSLRKKKVPEPVRQQIAQQTGEVKKPLKVWIGRAVKAYQLYRRVRHYFP